MNAPTDLKAGIKIVVAVNLIAFAIALFITAIARPAVAADRFAHIGEKLGYAGYAAVYRMTDAETGVTCYIAEYSGGDRTPAIDCLKQLNQG